MPLTFKSKHRPTRDQIKWKRQNKKGCQIPPSSSGCSWCRLWSQANRMINIPKGDSGCLALTPEHVYSENSVSHSAAATLARLACDHTVQKISQRKRCDPTIREWGDAHPFTHKVFPLLCFQYSDTLPEYSESCVCWWKSFVRAFISVVCSITEMNIP